MSGSNCCFLTCIQVSQGAGKVICYSHLFKNFPQFVVIHTIKSVSVVNEAIDLGEIFLAFSDPVDVDNLISDSSAFSKSILNFWKSLVHLLMKPSLKDFDHDLDSMWNECNCAVVWAFFGTGMKTDLFHSCDWNCWVFQICWHVGAALQQHFLLRSAIAHLEFYYLH